MAVGGGGAGWKERLRQPKKRGPKKKFNRLLGLVGGAGAASTAVQQGYKHTRLEEESRFAHIGAHMSEPQDR